MCRRAVDSRLGQRCAEVDSSVVTSGTSVLSSNVRPCGLGTWGAVSDKGGQRLDARSSA